MLLVNDLKKGVYMNKLEFTESEIDVLHFLYERPLSSMKNIVEAVTTIRSPVSAENVISRLKKLSMIVVKREVLFSLSEIGKSVIGKIEPNKFIEKEIERRGLPTTPLHRRNNYKWGDKSATVSVEPASSVGSEGEEAIKEILKKKNATKTVSAEPASTSLISNFVVDEWLFNNDELKALNSVVDNVLVELSDVTKKILVERRIIDSSGELTRLGKSLYTTDPLPPYNTHYFGVNRAERLVIEVLARRRMLLSTKSVVQGVLDLNGERDRKSVV